MQLQEWANTLVFGNTIAQKLLDPGRTEDAQPGAAIAVPTKPGRPPSLPLRRDENRTRLPSVHALADPLDRAKVLHHFANHELLAIELMALMLLRFPDADPAFRKTLAVTIVDEQRHLSLYVDRIEALGGALGGHPVSAFFWDCLAQSPTVEHFVAGMSLTLEQANLDFLTHWTQGFEQVGDDDTVTVLNQVHRDEVRHVRHGVKWLGAWAPEESLFDAWSSRLRPPLTTRRGRGPTFDRSGRARAGLDESFVRRVRITAHSRGRPPRLFWFNPQIEMQHAGEPQPSIVSTIAADLAPTLAVLAGEDDVLYVPRLPSPATRRALSDRGWPLPELREGAEPTTNALSGPSVSVPWGQSTEAAARLAGKDRAAQVLRSLEFGEDPRIDTVGGVFCTDFDQVMTACGQWDPVVIKARWSTAGRGLVRPPLDASRQGLVRRWLAAQGGVVVEPWRQRVIDLSLQATVTDEGLRNVELVRFFTDPRGRFQGVALGAVHRGLSTDIRRFLSNDGKDGRFVLRTLKQALTVAVRTEPQFRGPIGIDAFIAQSGDTFQLRPLVEINPRTTFGRVGHRVGLRMLAPNQSGAWLHVPKSALRRLGFSTFSALHTHLLQAHPPSGHPLTSGIVATTDPNTAQQVWTVLVAGNTADEALSAVWG
ncbi:MAG: DUF455 family protein [Myxococcota bacterium]